MGHKSDISVSVLGALDYRPAKPGTETLCARRVEVKAREAYRCRVPDDVPAQGGADAPPADRSACLGSLRLLILSSEWLERHADDLRNTRGKTLCVLTIHEGCT